MTAPAHHRPGGGFRNPWQNAELHGFRDLVRWRYQRRRTSVPPDPSPDVFPIVTPRLADRTSPDELQVTWLGHSTVLLQIGGLNVLTDPMWSDRATPVSFAGPKRLIPVPIAIDALPPIDIVLISHNHYDHLDKRTVKALARRSEETEWMLPLGLGALLERWGAKKTRELDWWARMSIRGVTFGCAPAQHFSARGFGDRGDTLWCGWTIASSTHRVYFAGDTALHPEFARIAERFGPFDLSMLPIGAYEPRWFMQAVHMNPEDAIEAYKALSSGGGGGAVLPIHWGTFRLTDEAMTEPPERFRRRWTEAGFPPEQLLLLKHGESRSTASSRR
jgi:N-acyl-phosphatidylethanolamine-hydrolysing phospholipase D